jgi:hypothetical protein
MKQNAAAVSDLNRQKMKKVGELIVKFYAPWNKPDKTAEWPPNADQRVGKSYLFLLLATELRLDIGR